MKPWRTIGWCSSHTSYIYQQHVCGLRYDGCGTIYGTGDSSSWVVWVCGVSVPLLKGLLFFRQAEPGCVVAGATPLPKSLRRSPSQTSAFRATSTTAQQHCTKPVKAVNEAGVWELREAHTVTQVTPSSVHSYLVVMADCFFVFVFLFFLRILQK